MCQKLPVAWVHDHGIRLERRVEMGMVCEVWYITLWQTAQSERTRRVGVEATGDIMR